MPDINDKKSSGMIVTTLIAALAGGGGGAGVKYAFAPVDREAGNRITIVERDMAVLKNTYDMRVADMKDMRVMISQITDRVMVLERFMWSGKTNARVKLKMGTSVFGMKNEILVALMAADEVWKELGQDLVMTSGVRLDPGSAHYMGYAVDLRTRDFSDEEEAAAYRQLAHDLGDGYLVTLEADHIHVEYRQV